MDTAIETNVLANFAEIDKIWDLCSNFVRTICAGRDPSHGHEHMQSVATTSKYIVQTEFYQHPYFWDLLTNTIIVAWLHDVADHKYDSPTANLEKQMDDFGFSNFSNYSYLKKAIKLISYSSENRAILAGNPIDYDNILTPEYALVRHIVSDADKLEAIGEIGIKRCEEYTIHVNPTLSPDEISEHIYNHAIEKLLRLKYEFIRTKTGKRLADPLHEEMVEILLKL